MIAEPRLASLAIATLAVHMLAMYALYQTARRLGPPDSGTVRIDRHVAVEEPDTEARREILWSWPTELRGYGGADIEAICREADG